MIPPHPRIMVDRFKRLIEQSGLTDFLDEYRAKGYQFSLAPPQHISTISDPPNKHIYIRLADLDESSFPESSLFLAQILHEVGHCIAYERGLDHTDEYLAWEIAKQISPVPLPVQWEELKADALSSYAPRELGDPLTQSEVIQLRQYGKCPVCKSKRLQDDPNTLDVGPTNPGRQFVRCGNCEEQFCLIWDPAKLRAVHKWVLSIGGEGRN